MKKILIMLFSMISLLTSICLIGLFGYSFWGNYYPFTFERTSEVAVLKESEIGINMLPAYYIVVKEEDNYSRHKVSKSVMTSTKLGDEIAGYKINDRFYTNKDIILDLFSTIIFILVGVLLFLLGIVFFIRNTALFQRLFNSLQNMRINKDVVKNVKHLLFIGAILFVGWKYFYYQTANYFKSFHNSSAEILEVERKPGYGRFNGPTFIFTVHFTVDDTEHIISKIKVSKDAYNRYVEGDTVIVHYEKNNPYYVYLPDTSS